LLDLATLQAISYIVGSFGVFVAAVYYVVNMRATLQVRREAYRTQQLALKSQEQALETRQAQLFMDLYKMCSGSEYMDAWDAFQNNKGKSVEELKKVYSNDPEFRHAIIKFLWYYEGMGVLVKEGLLDIRLIALLMTGMIKQWWEWWGPVAKEISVEWNWPRYAIETENLYDELTKYLEKHPELKT